MMKICLWPPLVAMALCTAPAALQAQAASDAAPMTTATATATAIGGNSGLVVSGIDVDVGGDNPTDARMNGWRVAQRLGWQGLWARMSGEPGDKAPTLSDSALDGIVSAIEVDHEEIGPNRYIARLAVIFDRTRASAHLQRFAGISASAPFLLMPVLQDAATRQSYEPDNPWLAAWARMRAGESPIDYVRIRPTPGDTILLNAWQAARRHLFLWRILIDRYQVADVLIPELIVDRAYEGGPLNATLIVRFGTNGQELGRVPLADRGGDMAALLDSAVRAADQVYVAALRDGRLAPDPNLTLDDASVLELEDSGPEIGAGDAVGGLSVRVMTPDDATLRAIQQAVRSTTGVQAVTLRSVSLGGQSLLDIQTALPLELLRYHLDQRGLRLEDGLLRSRAAGEAPLPPPPSLAAALAAPSPAATPGAVETVGGGD